MPPALPLSPKKIRVIPNAVRKLPPSGHKVIPSVVSNLKNNEKAPTRQLLLSMGMTLSKAMRFLLPMGRTRGREKGFLLTVGMTAAKGGVKGEGHSERSE